MIDSGKQQNANGERRHGAKVFYMNYSLRANLEPRLRAQLKLNTASNGIGHWEYMHTSLAMCVCVSSLLPFNSHSARLTRRLLLLIVAARLPLSSRLPLPPPRPSVRPAGLVMCI